MWHAWPRMGIEARADGRGELDTEGMDCCLLEVLRPLGQAISGRQGVGIGFRSAIKQLWYRKAGQRDL